MNRGLDAYAYLVNRRLIALLAVPTLSSSFVPSSFASDVDEQKVLEMKQHGDVISEPMLSPQIVANAVVNMANLPLEANVQFMTVMATKMPYIGRG